MTARFLVAALAVTAVAPAVAWGDGGETIETAVAIASSPFIDQGNTCGHVNDYDIP